MELMRMGGFMMWPLLLVSIFVLAIMVERLIICSRYRLPEKILPGSDREKGLDAVRSIAPLAPFAKELSATDPDEDTLTLLGSLVVADMESHLPLLGTCARLATMMGLLGTVIGMINTFSVIGSAVGGVDMTMMANGLWQALITTATGLSIALPAYFVQSFCQMRAQEMARRLSLVANVVLRHKDKGGV